MKKINEGYCAELFETDNHKLLKLYHTGWSEADVRQEFHSTKAVNQLNIPSPLVYELVELNGKHGFVMEKLVDQTMVHRIRKNPLNALILARQMAALHTKIHRTQLGIHPFPSQESLYLQKIQSCPSLSPAEKAALVALLHQLADSDMRCVCHGDFHPMNILYQGDQPVVIDWAYASVGDPRADVAGSYMITTLLSAASAARNSVERVLYQAFTPLFAETYLKEYLTLNGFNRQEILQWIPIRAATYLDLGLPPQINCKLREFAQGTISL